MPVHFRTHLPRIVASALSLALLSTPLATSAAPAPPTASHATWNLTIMHTNDTHAHLDNAAQRASLIKQIRSEAKNTLLLDAGDVFSGDLYFTEWKGQADLQLMNFVGYDAMTLGNHEFDKGPAILAAFIQNAKFPVVNANYDFTKDASLKEWVQQPITIPDTTRKTRPGIYPYVIKQIDGQLVAIIGVTTEDTAKSSSPGKDIVIHDAFPAVEKTIADINKQGINKVIVLSHLGYPRDKEMARQVEDIDIIVGGHTHTKIDKPEIVADDATPTLIVQANEYGKYIGRADLTFDENGVIQTNNVQVKLYPVEKNTPEHPQVKPLLDTYKAQLAQIKKQVIGKTIAALDGDRIHVRTQETNLGNLIADTMLAKAAELKGATLAIMNGGGIRASIEEGPITLGQLKTVLPFDNSLTILDVTGAQLIQALENGVSKVEAEEGAFPQVAGMRFVWNKAAKPGSRIVRVETKNQDGTYTTLDPAKTYRIATIKFLSDGGDGYTVFTEVKNKEDLYIADYDVFMDYIKAKGGTVAPKVEGRILE